MRFLYSECNKFFMTLQHATVKKMSRIESSTHIFLNALQSLRFEGNFFHISCTKKLFHGKLVFTTTLMICAKMMDEPYKGLML